MPVISPDLGYGTTLGFGTSTFTAAIRSISPSAQTREVVDASHLATVTNMRKLLGDLVDPGGFDCEIIWSSAAGKVPPIGAAEETITITLPDTSTILGKGGITSATIGPTIGISDLQTGSVTVSWTGLNAAGTGAGPVVVPAI